MRPSAFGRRHDACPRVLRDEQGMALVMALGIMMVLTLALGTVILLTATAARDANRTNAGQKAYALAETGLNNVFAQVAANYPNAEPGNPLWAASPASPVFYEGGTATWSGTFDLTTNTWTLNGTGRVTNPTGPGVPQITRNVSQRVKVLSAPQPFAPYGLYASDPSAPCTVLGGNISVDVPVYVASCLTLQGGSSSPAPAKAKIWEKRSPPIVNVQVGGTLDLEGGTSIGIASTPGHVKSISAGSCQIGGSASACTAAGFYANSYPPFAAAPQVSVNAQTVYNSANWAGATCSPAGGYNPFDNNSVRNNSRGIVGPDTAGTWPSSFDCSVVDAQTDVHRLAWDASTRQLTIQGSVFIDANFVTKSNKGFQYSGNGTIYFNGTVAHSGIICGPGSSWTASSNTCLPTWNPDLGSLLLVAANATVPPVETPPPFDVGAQAILEASAWAVGRTSSSEAFQSAGGATLGGSVITSKGWASIQGGGNLDAFIPLPSGSPTSYVYTLGRPSDYAGG